MHGTNMKFRRWFAEGGYSQENVAMVSLAVNFHILLRSFKYFSKLNKQQILEKYFALREEI